MPSTRDPEVGAVVEIEAAQEVLVRLAAPAVLGDDQPGHRFQQLARTQDRSARQVLLPGHALGRRVRDPGHVGGAIGDLDLVEEAEAGVFRGRCGSLVGRFAIGVSAVDGLVWVAVGAIGATKKAERAKRAKRTTVGRRASMLTIRTSHRRGCLRQPANGSTTRSSRSHRAPRGPFHRRQRSPAARPFR